MKKFMDELLFALIGKESMSLLIARMILKGYKITFEPVEERPDVLRVCLERIVGDQKVTLPYWVNIDILLKG